ncbi:preprotein translocase subunit SecA [Desulfurivibrio alkaliphilus]|uniref:Protein translocase subunit SecA n=1 Tax=Desulfurivibrio alkaliphilus (strain DSM 19089 / UNIQEM U267 / AHT2) TaxID=589865 RepID=D6Z480_DESAT|nr:preprotein translocase subunit SecA [Desulfurivibrio alkaliphilus]ADH86355.1 preprotein translocase, SecA subunit [Desulfurivibrio alkaliphilus AHT 2]
MLLKVMKKLFGSQNERVLKSLQPMVERINALEPEIAPLDDAALAAKTVEFRERLEQGATLDDLLPEAFAVVREASRRVLSMRHFDVQLIGGIVLHQGKIAEMKTGEGKTLVATLAVYLNALTGRGVHVVTVNDYLARRDAEWMGRLYNFLGLTVGVVIPGVDDAARKEAYAADVTYGTNNEFGFDYLRDNMKFSLDDFCQRPPHYAIVDEVDSILIDEARTPLIISGPADVSTDLYVKVNTLIPRFQPEVHYTVDEKARSVSLTEDGVALGEELLAVENLYDPRNIEQLHHLNQALKAHVLFKRDVDYLVADGQVVIVDEFTGRAMTGRRFSDGLHQALEAKEGVKVERENQTLASVTFQNYFRMYEKLAGMTGTADTEAAEFKKIYNLDVVVIPTHHPMVREDHPDAIYKTLAAKYRAIVREIKELHQEGRPVLVGTVSIDVSEKISGLLKKEKIPHSVLNAKQHAKEAEIVTEAGQQGRVTIATNMAGRGTDIKLGEGVPGLGGLHILGTSRHESRRIDNQLRGRAGRQGDPGSSRFFLSLEDDLLRVFGSDRISGIMDRLGMEEDEPIEHNMISKAIENAQRKVEGHNFEIRKHLLEYDDVMNKQREVIYGQRRELLESSDLKEAVTEMVTEQVQALAADIGDANIPSVDWDWSALEERVNDLFFFPLDWDEAAKSELNAAELESRLLELVKKRYQEREEEIGADNMRQLERLLLLQMVDSHWKEHLLNMDHLKEGIGLRGYGQKNPLIEYKREGFKMFREMIDRMEEQTVRTLFRVRLVRSDDVEELESQQRNRRQPMQLSRGEGGAEAGARQPVTRQGDKVGRNAPCPCGSGKKHKRCCGRQ